MNLFNLTQSELAFIAQMEENGGEVTDEILEDIAIRRENWHDKAAGYSRLILQLDSDVDVLSAEIKRLQAIKKAKENTSSRLRENLLQALLVFESEDAKGIRRFQTNFATISTRKSQAVEILDETELPEGFWIVKKEVSKSAISSALKAGEEVPGAMLKENISLMIK